MILGPKDKKDKEQILQKLSKYFSPQVYNSIFSGQLDVTINTSRKDLTVFFSDIKSFTTITEKLEPEVLTKLNTSYLTAMTDIAIEYGGTVDKYIGDAIMIFFGDPNSNGIKKDAVACVSMALEMKKALKEFGKVTARLGTELAILASGPLTGFMKVLNFVLGGGQQENDKNLGQTIDETIRKREIAIEKITDLETSLDEKLKRRNELREMFDTKEEERALSASGDLIKVQSLSLIHI